MTVRKQNEMVTTARITGVWYLILAISGVLGFMVFHSKIFVSDDAKQTLENLTNLQSLARTRLIIELVIIVSQALAAVWFYKLFKDTNEWAASALGIWGTVNAVIIMVSAIAIGAAIEIANSSSQTLIEKVTIIHEPRKGTKCRI